ncbi:hypothetical protein EJ04DRAFT_528534 [Polyplosphaeria fusca]|uniref:Uncharacterized protein n=1 Tax=Polyplosphaeria fusca TaxID=682080 RepID=A0A9P4UU54_9PLEO|nr:hypothetical protein EJ04DRAFT_528534 [Polyplosphaeria fusca]
MPPDARDLRNASLVYVSCGGNNTENQRRKLYKVVRTILTHDDIGRKIRFLSFRISTGDCGLGPLDKAEEEFRSMVVGKAERIFTTFETYRPGTADYRSTYTWVTLLLCLAKNLRGLVLHVPNRPTDYPNQYYNSDEYEVSSFEKFFGFLIGQENVSTAYIPVLAELRHLDLHVHTVQWQWIALPPKLEHVQILRSVDIESGGFQNSHITTLACRYHIPILDGNSQTVEYGNGYSLSQISCLQQLRYLTLWITDEEMFEGNPVNITIESRGSLVILQEDLAPVKDQLKVLRLKLFENSALSNTDSLTSLKNFSCLEHLELPQAAIAHLPKLTDLLPRSMRMLFITSKFPLTGDWLEWNYRYHYYDGISACFSGPEPHEEQLELWTRIQGLSSEEQMAVFHAWIPQHGVKY